MAKFGRLCGAKYLQRHDDLQRFSAEVLAAARADLALCSEHISAGSSSLKEGFMSDAAKRRGAEHGSWRQGLRKHSSHVKVLHCCWEASLCSKLKTHHHLQSGRGILTLRLRPQGKPARETSASCLLAEFSFSLATMGTEAHFEVCFFLSDE